MKLKTIFGVVLLALVLTSFSATLVQAQLGTTTPTTTPVTPSPGTPVTGVGDVTFNLIVIGLSAVVMVVGGYYIGRMQSKS